LYKNATFETQEIQHCFTEHELDIRRIIPCKQSIQYALRNSSHRA